MKPGKTQGHSGQDDLTLRISASDMMGDGRKDRYDKEFVEDQAVKSLEREEDASPGAAGTKNVGDDRQGPEAAAVTEKLGAHWSDELDSRELRKLGAGRE